MRRIVLLGCLLFATPAFADEPPTPAPTAGPRPAPPASPNTSVTPAASVTPVPVHRGVAVLALDGATHTAWALAQKVYASPTLRPPSLDEPHARVLAGENPADDAPKDLRDLAETRDAIRGDDAPSRQLLASVARDLSLEGVLVVDGTESGPRARLFLAEPSKFDAASWSPVADDKGALSWDAAVRSLERTLQPKITPSPTFVPPPPAPKTKEKTEESKPFYASPWFWGALGGAAFLGGAIYFATRDSGPGSIHLQVQVPR